MDNSFDDGIDGNFMPQTERSSRHPEIYSSTQLIGVCSNRNCIYKGQGLPTEKVCFDGHEKEYCMNCSSSIKDKWVCSYCKEVGCKEDTSPEHPDWVQCCMKHCKRWVHQDCEKIKGFKDIKTLVLDKKYKYICNLCRSKKHIKKYRDQGSDFKKADKFSSIDDYFKNMIIRRKLPQMNYTYLHSETYQSIEKLLSSFDKGGSSLSLNETEIREDFLKFNEALGANVFEIPGNSVIKSFNQKSEVVNKQVVKKHGKKILKN